MAQLGDTVVTGSLAVSNCIYGSVTCATTVCRATFGDSSNGEHNANNIISNGLWYYNSGGPSQTLGASTDDGALYSQAYSDCWVGQIAQDYINGNLFVRAKCNGTWKDWQAVVTKSMLGSNAYTSTTIPTKVSQLTNDSGFTSNTGTVTAITVSVNGVSATSTAGCATASISLTNVPATNACCAKQICRCGYTGCYDFDVALVDGCSSVSDAYIYASSRYRLKFCSCNGILNIKDSNNCTCTTLDREHLSARCVIVRDTLCACKIYSGSTKTNIICDIEMSVYCNNGSVSSFTCFIFCGLDGRMHGDVKGVLNAVTPSSPQNGDIWID